MAVDMAVWDQASGFTPTAPDIGRPSKIIDPPSRQFGDR